MMTARTVRGSGLLAVLALTGCVDRKFVIESNVPNAQVYVDNKSIGAAPAYAPFEYYGYYTITLVHPGYETVVTRKKVAAPWYAYPPLDFLAEALWPFPIRDTRRFYIEMHESTPTRTDDILNAADALRQRGQLLPPPERPAEPRPRPGRPGSAGPAGGPTIGPPAAPGAGAAPPPVPAPTPAPGVVPSVQPGYTPAAGGSYIR
ncbi:MAG: PEGA domain-containing protein [Planctomycetes bacterium]|nr:PEGA domain-containing protein [Planctomycetota bacterium]